MTEIIILFYKSDSGSIMAKGYTDDLNDTRVQVTTVLHGSTLNHITNTFSPDRILYHMTIHTTGAVGRLFTLLVDDATEFMTEKHNVRITIDDSVGDLFNTITMSLMRGMKENVVMPFVTFDDSVRKRFEEPILTFGDNSIAESIDSTDTCNEGILVDGESSKYVVFYSKQGKIYCSNGYKEYEVHKVNNWHPTLEPGPLKLTSMINFISEFSKDVTIKLVRGIMSNSDNDQDKMWIDLLGTVLDKLGYTYEYHEINPLTPDEYKLAYIEYFYDSIECSYDTNARARIVSVYKDGECHIIQGISFECITKRIFELFSDDEKYVVVFFENPIMDKNSMQIFSDTIKRLANNYTNIICTNKVPEYIIL